MTCFICLQNPFTAKANSWECDVCRSTPCSCSCQIWLYDFSLCLHWQFPRGLHQECACSKVWRQEQGVLQSNQPHVSIKCAEPRIRKKKMIDQGTGIRYGYPQLPTLFSTNLPHAMDPITRKSFSKLIQQENLERGKLKVPWISSFDCV